MVIGIQNSGKGEKTGLSAAERRLELQGQSGWVSRYLQVESNEITSFSL
jgi:hypothetical protein